MADLATVLNRTEGVRAGSFVAGASYRWDADHVRWVIATVD